MKYKAQFKFGNLARIASLVIVLISSTVLKADEIVQQSQTDGGRSLFGGTVINGLPSFTLFDPALGTLNSVSIKIDTEMIAWVCVANDTEDPFGVSARAETSLTVITPNGDLVEPANTDSIRNSWDDGGQLEPGQVAFFFPRLDRQSATFTETAVNGYIDHGVLDENGNPITQLGLGLVAQMGAQGTFTPSASSLPVAHWFNEGQSRWFQIELKITVTMTYDYTPF